MAIDRKAAVTRAIHAFASKAEVIASLGQHLGRRNLSVFVLVKEDWRTLTLQCRGRSLAALRLTLQRLMLMLRLVLMLLRCGRSFNASLRLVLMRLALSCLRHDVPVCVLEERKGSAVSSSATH